MLNRRNFLKLSAATTASLMLGELPSVQAATYVKCPILMYHYVTRLPDDADRYLRDLAVHPDLFTEHCQWLSDNGYTTITMAQLYEGLFNDAPLPENPVVMTFDDGYADAFAFAMPILQRFGMVGTFFIVPNYMDAPGYLTWGQAGAMLGAGMEIENHSMNHTSLRGRNLDYLAEEIGIAADRIEATLGKRPRFFCYPFGHWDNYAIKAVQDSGHLLAVTTQDGTLMYQSRPYSLRRVRVRGITTTASLRWLVSRRV